MFTAIGIITTIIIAKIALHAAHFRFGHRWHHGGGCRRRAWRRWHGYDAPIDLRDIGATDYDAYGGWGNNDLRRGPAHGELRVRSILTGLELNARQQAEANDVLAILRSARVSQLSLALRACSRQTFDADLASAAIGPHAPSEALDALEHLHTILTEEQRAALERLTGRN